MDATSFKLNTRRNPEDDCLAFGSFYYTKKKNAFYAMKNTSDAAKM